MAPPTMFVQNRRKFVSLDRAVQELVNHNDRMLSTPSELEADAIRRLLSVVKKTKAGNSDSKAAKKIVKLIKDLDVVFFGGVLLGHIDVSWGDTLAFWNRSQDVNKLLGFTYYLGPGQCEICLNRQLILNIPDEWHSFKQAWNTILHEMAHALTMVRCEFQAAVDHHHSHFRTTIHAVHRHSIQRFGIPAINFWEGAYKHNHFMSDHWALHDPSGEGEIDTTSYQDHHVSNNPLTTDEPRAAKHRRHGKNENATTESYKRETYDGNAQGKSYETVPLFNNDYGNMSQDRNVYFPPHAQKPDNKSRPASGSKRMENGLKKNSKTDHPISVSRETRDNGYRKHDDTTGYIKAKYPQGPFVHVRGEPSCTIM